ncbi:MAG TPA: HAMP domain-containing sensor histidine kinase [Acidimicrobiia bacterium]|nr:HAMP domain-containing sensor histidine kinase [Acidimicrobiia bacterium]
MTLRKRVLLGCLVVAAVVLVTDVVLAATFRSFLLGRIDQQIVEGADPLVHGRFRNLPGGSGVSPERNSPGPRPGGTPAGSSSVYTEYFIGVVAADGTVTRVGPGLHENDLSAPELSPATLTGHLSAADDLRPFTVPSSTGRGKWRMVALQRSGDEGTFVFGAQLKDLDATFGRMLAVEGVATVLILAALAGLAASVLWAFRERAANEARLRQFVADASHELRTPLTSIRGYAELWRAGGLRGGGDVDDAMRRMEQEARRMGLLVDDMLLLARLDQGRPLETTALALDRLVDEAVRDARAVEPDRPIDLVADPVTVTGDDHRLRQVVGNLLANARLHTPPGTPVHVSVRAVGERVRLEVADEGPGLEPEMAARVFERFYRGDPARTRASGGSGLGLSIVAAVAEAHGGRVSVDTAPGAGARFVVELPLVHAHAERIRTSVASGT